MFRHGSSKMVRWPSRFLIGNMISSIVETRAKSSPSKPIGLSTYLIVARSALASLKLCFGKLGLSESDASGSKLSTLPKDFSLPR